MRHSIVDTFLDKRFRKSKTVVSRKIGNEFILVPIHRQSHELDGIYSMNDVAAHIWELIDESRSVADIRNAVVEKFDVETEIAEHDITAFLMQLEQVGIVAEVPDGMHGRTGVEIQ